MINLLPSWKSIKKVDRREKMDHIRNIFFIIAGLLIAIGLLGWLGLHIQPTPFPSLPEQTQPLITVPVPAGLPAPVERARGWCG